LKATKRTIRALLATGLAVTGTISGLTSSEAAADGADCLVDVDLFMTPGLSAAPSSGTFSSNGEKGSAECEGVVNGKEITESALYGVMGKYGAKDPDSCLTGGDFELSQTFVLPVADGFERVEGTAKLVFGALDGGGPLTGPFTSDRFSGTVELMPEKGDCVSAPITRLRVVIKGLLK
jgi:hypothetical protein